MHAMMWSSLLRILQLAGVCALLVLGLAAPVAADEAPRLALVIGNSQYGATSKLPNARNDAALMARTLAAQGFAVTERYELTRDGFASEVDQFAARVPKGAMAFVYYAGHGMQIGGSNYLVPVDMPLTSEASAKLRSYALDTLLERMYKAGSVVNVVVLDACRNNPFQPTGAVRYRSFRGLGLARTPARRGTLIAYSTSPGQLAPDGKGDNSIYTLALANTLAQPGRELEAIFRQVGNEVRRQTRDDQIPWYESSLADGVWLGGSAAAGARGAVSRAVQPAQPWFRTLNTTEWSQLDWEIQQRVRRLTPDELPALRHQAEGGSVVAQTVLGLAYREGIAPITVTGSRRVARTHADNGTAWRWLSRAAQAGFPVAQAEVGEMYYAGHGVARDLDKSIRWLEEAARAAYPRARLDLIQVRAEVSPGALQPGEMAKVLLENVVGPLGGKAPPGQPVREPATTK